MAAIADLCSPNMDPKDERFDASNFQDELDRIETLLVYSKQDDLQPAVLQPSSIPATDTQRFAELYRLAGLLYLYRSARKLPPTSPRVVNVMKVALAIVGSVESCSRHVFPLAIIGAEARSDDDRLVILNLISRTQERYNGSSIHRAQRFIEACWAQEDLHDGQVLDYRKKLDSIMTSSENLPTFA